MHYFFKFIFGINLYMFRTVPLSIIRSFALYTQQWYTSYRFADSLRTRRIRMEPSWSCSRCWECSYLHSQQRVLTHYDMLSQHAGYRNKLNCECFNITLARKNVTPWRWSKRSKHIGVILSVFLSVILCECNCWLIIKVILRNARCNNKVYISASGWFYYKNFSRCTVTWTSYVEWILFWSCWPRNLLFRYSRILRESESVLNTTLTIYHT